VRLEFSISEDRMKAYVLLRKEKEEEKPLTLEELMGAIKTAGIKHGILEENLVRLAASPVYNTPVLIAEGTPPLDGEDGRVEFIKEEAKEVSEEKEEKFRIDLKEIPKKKRIIVKKGETIAKIVPPTPGVDGKDVFGNPVKSKPGRMPEYHIGSNVVLDGDKIVATRSGILVVEKGGTISVLDTLEVEEVDYSTGNIEFPGKLLVKGDVKPDFVVKVQGDITIKGVIEAATVISLEGNVTAGGIKGRGKAFVKAKGVLKSVFVENAEVEAGEIVVERLIENSTVRSESSVILSGNKGSIRGGLILARMKVEAWQIGSPLGVKTRVEVGTDPTLNERIKILEAQISLDKANVEKLTKALIELRKLKSSLGTLPPDKEALLQKITNTLINLKEAIQKNESELNELVKKAQEMVAEAKVVAKEMIFPGVEIVMFNRIFHVEKPIVKAVVYYRDGEIRVGGYSE